MSIEHAFADHLLGEILAVHGDSAAAPATQIPP
jgi:hypothetical protein